MAVDGFTIEGDIRSTSAQLTFSPELAGVLQTVPPTETSLELTRSIGEEVGSAVLRSFIADEIATADQRTVTGIATDIFISTNLPLEAWPTFMEGLEQPVNLAKTSAGIIRFFKVIEENRPALLAEIDRQQGDGVRRLTDVLRAWNTAYAAGKEDQHAADVSALQATKGTPS